MQTRTIIAILRDVLQSCTYFAMSNRVWQSLYKSSFVSLLNKVSLGLASIALAYFQVYFFYHALNKNVDGWLNTISSILGTSLTSIATYGEMIASMVGLSFSVGIWIFLAGLTVGLVNQLLGFCLNLYRSMEAPDGQQQKHYQQAMVQQAFNAAYLALTISTLTCSILISVNPLLITGLCLAVVVFGLSNSAWRLGPNPVKEKIKQGLHLAKPEHYTSSPSYKPLFTAPLYISKIKEINTFDEKKIYLLSIIESKISTLKHILPRSNKIDSKIRGLELLARALQGSEPLDSKIKLAKNHPGVFQSFWREKSEVEQLYDAVYYFRTSVAQDFELTGVKGFR